MENVALELLSLALIALVGNGVRKINIRNGSIERALAELKDSLPCADMRERVAKLEEWKESIS